MVPGGTATCTSAGNNYTNGITYTVDDLTIVLQDDVVVATNAANEDGVSLIASGELVVSGGGGAAISTLGADADGVHVSSADGPIAVEVTGVATAGLNSDGVDAYSGGAGADGAVSVTATGPIATNGYKSDGVYAYSAGGPVTVSVGEVSALSGLNTYGIYAHSGGAGANGAVSVTATGTVVHGGTYSSAIHAQSAGGPVTVSAAAITTTGTYGDGLYARSYGVGADGAVSVTVSGTISTTGREADGVIARSSDGPVTVDVAGISTLDDYANGVIARSFGVGAYGAISVTATGPISTTGFGSTGVSAISADGGPVTVNVAAVSTGDEYASGVFTRSGGAGADGAVDVTATGPIATNGYKSDGVYAYSVGGPVTVEVARISTAVSESEGVNAYSGGAGADGAVSVTATGPIVTGGYESQGILAISAGGPVAVSAAGITTTGSYAEGVYARSSGAGADGAVEVTVTGAIMTAGQGSHGVLARSTGGPVTVNAAGVTTNNDIAAGIVAIALGAGANGAIEVTATGPISTAGFEGRGISAYAAGGPIMVNAAGITTNGNYSDGVSAESNGFGPDGAISVTATGPIATGDANSRGIHAESASGPVTVSATSVATTGSDSEGIYADSSGTGAEGAVSVTATGPITTGGFESDGVRARSTGGPVTVSATNIATTGNYAQAIFATSAGAGVDGAVAVMATGLISTLGVAEGVFASSTGGPVSVDVAGVTTAGFDAGAIDARSMGVGADGAVSVTVTGAVMTAGANADGIFVSGATSLIEVTAAGSVASAMANSIHSLGTTVDTVMIRGGLSGTTALNDGADSLTFFSTAMIGGIGMTDGGAGADALTFDGLMAGIDPNLFANWETATFTNGAFITAAPVGASLLSAPGGIFVVNGSTLDLGDDDDLLGTLTIDATSQVIANGDTPGMNTITGDLLLAGMLDLTDGDPDDQTDVTGLLGGMGGTIALDVSFAPTGPVASDLVTFGGDLTGTAFLSVTPVPVAGPPGAPPPLLSFGGVDMATIALATPVEVNGLSYALTSTGGSYFLTPDGVTAEVAGILALGTFFGSLDRDYLGDLGSRIGTGSALRRPGMADGGVAIWGRMSGVRHEGEAGSGIGQTDFELSHGFVQLGLDLFRADLGDGALTGYAFAHAGRSQGDVSPNGSASPAPLAIDSYGVGLGTTWYLGDGASYVDAVGMVNFHDFEVGTSGTDAVAWTVGLEAGTRVPLSDGVTLVPLGQVVYSHADVDDLPLSSGTGTVASIKDAESLSARALVTVEFAFSEASSVQVGGGIGYEFLDGPTLTLPGTTVTSDQTGFAAEAMVRGATRLDDGVTAFADVYGRRSIGDSRAIDYGIMLGLKIDL